MLSQDTNCISAVTVHGRIVCVRVFQDYLEEVVEVYWNCCTASVKCFSKAANNHNFITNWVRIIKIAHKMWSHLSEALKELISQCS